MKNDIERLLEGKEAVIFDVDGTLIDSMGVWEEVDRIYLTNRCQRICSANWRGLVFCRLLIISEM